jgi:hypothetical protein
MAARSEMEHHDRPWDKVIVGHRKSEANGNVFCCIFELEDLSSSSQQQQHHADKAEFGQILINSTILVSSNTMPENEPADRIGRHKERERV